MSLLKMLYYMPSNYDFRISLIFCYQLKKNSPQAHEMLIKSYGVQILNRSQGISVHTSE